MNSDLLNKKLNIIFSKEISDINNYQWTFNLLEGKFCYPNSQILIDLYYTIEKEPSLQSEYFEQIIENAKSITTSISFWTLISLSKKEEAYQILQEKQYFTSEISNIFDLILIILDNNLISLSPEELYNIRNDLSRSSISSDNYHLINAKNDLLKKLIDLAAVGLQSQLKSSNIEINRDKEEVKKAIKSMDFDDKYCELLSEIDEFLNTKSKIVSAGLISNLRSFLNDLIIDLAKRVASANNETIPKYKDSIGNKRSPIGNAREYLKIKLELSDKDNDFINSFIDILHSEGGHSFISSKEYFRLARNIAIEISLFLLSKATKHN